MHRKSAVTLAALLAASATAARAQESVLDRPLDKESWPTQIVRRPLTLAPGMLELTLPVNSNLSDGAVGEPVFLNPSLYYGVTQDLTVGLRHFVGLCVTGSSNGCRDVYNDVSVDAIWSLARRADWDAALGLAFNVARFDPFTTNAEVRVAWRYHFGKVAALTVAPQLNVGVTERDAPPGTPVAGTTATTSAFGNREILSVPASLQVQLTDFVAVAGGIGLVGDLDPQVGSFGDTYTIPVSFEVDWTLSRMLDLGATLSFQNLLGKNSTADQRFGKIFARARF